MEAITISIPVNELGAMGVFLSIKVPNFNSILSMGENLFVELNIGGAVNCMELVPARVTNYENPSRLYQRNVLEEAVGVR